ncbi:MAG: S-layer homology domain-containing protein [Oscillospiraceae bacterium]|nr:S-layer homology domain-containing protein [Oscillospiraceae bacterium]
MKIRTKVLSLLLIFSIALTLVPMIGASPVFASMNVSRFPQTFVGLDFVGNQNTAPATSGNNAPSNQSAVLDGRVLDGVFDGANGNRHRLFFMTFDLADLTGNFDDIYSINLGIHTSGDPVNNNDSQFNVYLFTPELAARINQTDIPTYGAARNLGLVDYRSNMIWNRSGLTINTAITSPNILPYLQDYFTQNPSETIIGVKFFGTNWLANFHNHLNTNSALRPQLIVNMPAELNTLIDASEILSEDMPRFISESINLSSSIAGFPGVTVSWRSLNPSVIDDNGTLLSPPEDNNEPVDATLEATISLGGVNRVLTYTVTVSCRNMIDFLTDLTTLDLGNLDAVTENLTLPLILSGVPVRWESSNPAVISNSGVVNRPYAIEQNVQVELTAFGEFSGVPFSHTFVATVLRQIGGADGFPALLDPMHISDQAFFGVWNPALNGGAGGWVPQQVFLAHLPNNQWVTYNRPILRYDLFPDLRYVEAAARAGDYPLARELLLQYYRTRDTQVVPAYRIPANRHDLRAEMFGEKIGGWMEIDPPMGHTHIGPDWDWHTINLSMSPRSSTTVFLLDADMSPDRSAVEIRSREWGNGEYAAYLALTVAGERRTFPVTADMFISAGENINRNFGQEEILLVREAAGPTETAPDGTPIPMPFGSYTARPYFHFHIPNIPGGQSVTNAQLRIFARSNSGAPKRVFAFRPQSQQVINNTFNETGFTWARHFPIMFNFKETGYVWHSAIQSMWNLEMEWINGMTRFYHVNSLIERYRRTGEQIFAYRALEKAISLYTQQPSFSFPRRLEPGWRTEHLNTLKFATLNSELMTPELWTALMKYSHSHVAQGALQNVGVGGAFNQVNAQLVGAFRTMGYFPEIQIATGWDDAKRGVYNLYNLQINPDGSYAESTSGYIGGVINELINMLELIARFGDDENDPLYAAMLEHLRMLTRYFVDLTMPHRQTVPWGSGGRGNPVGSAYNWSNRFPALDPDRFFEYIHRNGASGTRPYWNSVLYPYKAIAFLRSGWGTQDFGAMISATHGGSHSHPDDLALDVSAFGRFLLVEAGGGSYVAGSSLAGISNQTFSHNTIEINSGNQLRHPGTTQINQPQKLLLATNSIFDFVEAGSNRIWARHIDDNGNEVSGFEIHRKVLFVHNRFWIVSDYIFPDDNLPHNFRQVWRPDARNFLEVDPITKAMSTNFGETSANIQVVPADPEEITARIDRNWGTNPQFGEEITDFVSYLRTDHVGPATFDTVLLPDPAGERTYVNVTRLPLDVPAYVATALQIDIGVNVGFYYSANDFDPGFPPPIPNPPSIPPPANWSRPPWNRPSIHTFPFPTRTFGRFTTDGQMAYVELDVNDRQAMVALTKATTLMQDDFVLVELGERVYDLGIIWNERTLELANEIGTLPASGVRIFSDRIIDQVFLNGSPIAFTFANNYVYINREPTPVLEDEDEEEYETGNGDNTTSNNPPSDDVQNDQGSNETNTANTPGNSGGLPASGNPQVSNPAQGNRLPIIVASTPSGNVYGMPPIDWAFRDTNAHWANSEISNMLIRGVVTGNDNGYFLPDNNITRAEFTAILARALELPSASTNMFTDVSDDDWFASDIARAYQAGIIAGFDDRSFLPNNTITRQQMAVILMRALQIFGFENDNYANLIYFADHLVIAEWAVDAISGAVGAELMTGFDNGEFSPLSHATRAQATVVIARLLGLADTSERGLM